MPAPFPLEMPQYRAHISPLWLSAMCTYFAGSFKNQTPVLVLIRMPPFDKQGVGGATVNALLISEYSPGPLHLPLNGTPTLLKMLGGG
ncbi:hypothetical protein JTB14_036491 [Gonioctena quinquepunctata]|nr:hypothetical protein JTB14_036491 [Gonioctena quinquepunctata]